MKIVKVSNDNMVIKARNEQDFEQAKTVAEKIERDNSDFVFCSFDESERWVQITACWRPFQIDDFKAAYEEAKKPLLRFTN